MTSSTTGSFPDDISRILGKLRARDRAQLVVIAYETGLVAPGND